MWLSTLPHQFPHCCLHLSPRPEPHAQLLLGTDGPIRVSKAGSSGEPLPPSRPHSHLGPRAARPGPRKRGTRDATRRQDSRPGRGSLEGAASGAQRQRDGVPGAPYSPCAGPAPHSQSHSSARSAAGRRAGIFEAAASADPHGERDPTRSPALACATLLPRLALSRSSRCAAPALRAARPPPEVWLKSFWLRGAAGRIACPSASASSHRGAPPPPPPPPPRAQGFPAERSAGGLRAEGSERAGPGPSGQPGPPRRARRRGRLKHPTSNAGILNLWEEADLMSLTPTHSLAG